MSFVRRLSLVISLGVPGFPASLLAHPAWRIEPRQQLVPTSPQSVIFETDNHWVLREAAAEPEDFQSLFAVNITGTFNICHSALQEMIRRKRGSIVNFSSTTGANDVGANIAAYVASKGGVLMLTKSIAVDHAQDGIRANVIAPGPCDTPMLRSVMTDEELEAFGRRVPVGRVGLPEELGLAALFLASDEASFVTGALLYVDGGQAAQIGPILGA